MLSSMELLAQQADRTYFQLARLESMTEWWQWLLLIAVCLLVTTLVVVMYVYDSVELPVGVALVLGTLRILAFAGLVVFFLRPELRTEQKVVKASRVSVLVDTSSSMALEDSNGGTATGPSRIRQVAAELENGELIKGLREKHDVIAYAFNEDVQPIELASFPRLADESAPDAATAARSPRSTLAKGSVVRHSGWSRASARTRSKAKASCGYMGCSTQRVPSLSKTAMRSRGSRKSGDPEVVTASTRARIADRGAPSAQEGRGGASGVGDAPAGAADGGAALPHDGTASRRTTLRAHRRPPTIVPRRAASRRPSMVTRPMDASIMK